MSAEFSANLSTLRKEKGISQKDAADALGISQALLSHYEKGIRECSLDFVKKASAYYDVTADFLLGLSDNKHTFHELLSQEDIPSDSRLNAKTLFRCILYLSEAAEKSGDNAQFFFDNYFSLCVRKYLSVVQKEEKHTRYLCDMLLAELTDETSVQPTEKTPMPEEPLSLNTVKQHCSMLFTQRISRLL